MHAAAVRKTAIVLANLAVSLAAPCALASDATSFSGPTDWTIGDTLSAYQEWDIFVSSSGNLPDVGFTAFPALPAMPTLSALPPGFLSSTSNFYAFSDDYSIVAEIRNQAAAAPAGHGTLVRVQLASTLNPDFGEGVILDTLALQTPTGDPLVGGTFAEACTAELLYTGPAVIGGPFGDVSQHEWLVEFWLPDFVDDFDLAMTCRVHGTFLALRVDTLNAAQPFCGPYDVDCNCRTDARDAASLLANLAGPDIPAPPPTGDPTTFARADLDSDQDVDLHDLAEIQIGLPPQ